MLDRNHDGRVYTDDIHHMMTSLGYSLAESDIKAFIHTAANGGQCSHNTHISIRTEQLRTWRFMCLMDT